MRILLVEDNEADAVDMLEDLALSSPVTHVRVFDESGLRGALANEPFDIAIVDHQLPTLRGIDALRIIRRARPDTPVIYVSGAMRPAIGKRAMREGARDYVAKSDLARLAAVVERELRDAATRELTAREVRVMREAARSHQALAEDIVAVLPDPMLIVDERGRVHDSSPAFAAAFSVSDRAALGRPVQEVLADIGFPDLLESLDDPAVGELDEVPVSRTVGPSTEYFRAAKVRLASSTKTLLRFRDVTHFLSEREAADRTRRLEALGRLAGGMAHDFNNLLGAMMTHSDLLSAELGSDTTADAEMHLEVLQRTIQSAGNLSARLLALGESSTRRDASATAVDEAVARTLELVGRLLPPGVRVTSSLGLGAAHACASVGDIEQIVINLVNNAADALPHGGTVRVETALIVDVERWVELRVTDDGTGMDPETVSQIFEPYFTTRRRRGTGLGLTTVMGIVAQRGGTIDVSSEPGVGTEMRIRLRHSKRRAAARPEGPTADARTLDGPVLIVEDFSEIRYAMVDVLEAAGYPVLAAASAEEALDVTSRFEIGMLVADVMMPGRSGVELATELREGRVDLPVLFVSGYVGQIEGLDRVLQTGRARLLRKPFAPAALLGAVGELVDLDGSVGFARSSKNWPKQPTAG